MIKNSDFLRAILPPVGHYAVVSIKKGIVKQTLIDDFAKLKPLASAALKAGEDLYFGCASYLTADSRKKNNVQYVKSFWIDLDCGEGTGYEDKQRGYEAVRALCKKTGLPKPWVVDSGRGLHVYWPFATPILASLWDTYARRLVELCASSGLSIKDPGCSTDVARILRIPGSHNYKNPDEPLNVKILIAGVISEWGELKDCIQAACGEVGINGFHEAPVAVATQKRNIDPLTAALMGNQVSNYRQIVSRSVVGTGCEYIKNALESPGDVSEPLWRALLSTAVACEDKDKAIHWISKGHPEYSREATEAKAALIQGPYNCTSYADTGGSATCKGCTNYGKIINPIQLGKSVLRAENPIVMVMPGDGAEGVVVQSLLQAEPLPDMPWPYFRGAKGGIYTAGAVEPDGTKGEDILIYEYNLDVVRRVIDPEVGETIIAHLSLPRDGVKEITIPIVDALAADRLRDKLGFSGVIAGKEQMAKIGNYITRAVKQMQAAQPAEPAMTQMGWTEDRTGIVWGRTMFTANGARYCPPASRAMTVANIMRTSGTLEAWESVVNRYAGEGFEMYACCMAIAFGSMLNHYTYEDPTWIHLVSSESGTGKTTLTRVMSSIWGDPRKMAMVVTDTNNAVEKRRVAFNSMAIMQDEITNLPPDKLSQLAYAQSQGREKLRLTSGSQEMVNHERRDNTFVTTGNRYVTDVLSAFKTNAAGEFARLIEIPFPVLQTVMSGEDHFGAVLTNYGHAGPIFAKWLVTHESELRGRVDLERKRFDMAFKSVSKERNWVAQASVMFAAMRILQEELGLLTSYNIDRMYAVWTAHMVSVRDNTAAHIVSHENLLGDFINENYNNIIIPDSHNVTNPASTSLFGRKTEREARARLVIRWEKDTQQLFIAQNELKAYCIKRTHSFVDLMVHYMKDPQFGGLRGKRMGAGTGVVTSPVKVLVFNVAGGELGNLLQEVV